MKTINKLRNIQGYEYKCHCCDREIKHVFKVEGLTGVYGSECVESILPNSQSKIKELMETQKRLDKILRNKKVYGWEEYKTGYNYNDDQLIEHFLNKGGF